MKFWISYILQSIYFSFLSVCLFFWKTNRKYNEFDIYFRIQQWIKNEKIVQWVVAKLPISKIEFQNQSLFNNFSITPQSAPFKKNSKQVDFSLWGKQCGFHKLHLFSDFTLLWYTEYYSVLIHVCQIMTEAVNGRLTLLRKGPRVSVICMQVNYMLRTIMKPKVMVMCYEKSVVSNYLEM